MKPAEYLRDYFGLTATPFPGNESWVLVRHNGTPVANVMPAIGRWSGVGPLAGRSGQYAPCSVRGSIEAASLIAMYVRVLAWRNGLEK